MILHGFTSIQGCFDVLTVPDGAARRRKCNEGKCRK
jgi:hypothetical protein